MIDREEWEQAIQIVDKASFKDAESRARAMLQAFDILYDELARALNVNNALLGWVNYKIVCKACGTDGPVFTFKAENLLYPQFSPMDDLVFWIYSMEPYLRERDKKFLEDNPNEDDLANSVRYRLKLLARGMPQ